MNGRKECVAQGCSLLEATNCSSGQRMIKRPGQCCPTCMDENDAHDDDDDEPDRVAHGDKTTQVRSNNYIKYPPHCRAKLAKLSAECKLRCKHSLQLDGHRCPVCKCADEQVGNAWRLNECNECMCREARRCSAPCCPTSSVRCARVRP